MGDGEQVGPDGGRAGNGGDAGQPVGVGAGEPGMSRMLTTVVTPARASESATVQRTAGEVI